MKIIAFAALAAALLTAGCASTGQKLAYDPEGCTLNGAGPYASRSSQEKIRSGDPEFRSKANCASNRALDQMVSTKMAQRRNNATSFSPEPR